MQGLPISHFHSKMQEVHLVAGIIRLSAYTYTLRESNNAVCNVVKNNLEKCYGRGNSNKVESSHPNFESGAAH